MKLKKAFVAAAAAAAPAPAHAGGFVTLPTSGADIRVRGSNNPAADPMFFASNPFASGCTLLGNLSQPLLADVDANGSLDWVGTFSDQVWRNDATGTLTFALRLEDTRPFLSPANTETEINLIWRSGFTGTTTAVADDFVFRAGTQPGREVPGSAYSPETVGFRTDTLVGEGNPNSGWYLVQTNATSFTVQAGLLHIRQSAGTGPEARPQRDWVIAGFAPVTPVPEPGTWALLLAGLGVVARIARRRG